ncbi:hypothetical protein IB276_17785 [Ensifer sp. ENS04]|uniref:hypothetical protein n=1 Tax=Ensifer sp. ENS04 TaxID=2769281 RepID=UPI0017811DA1|nr:hypothetical protein [Ensifer sp. ENS04]MBD9541309.1 hypothetical protein [Ensifer sp. ENS04]
MRKRFDPIAHAEEAWRMFVFPVKITAAAKEFTWEATGTGSSTRYIRSIRYEENGIEHHGAFAVRIIHGSGITPPYWVDSSRNIRGGLERHVSDAQIGLANGWASADAEEAVERIAICLWKAMRPTEGIDVRSDHAYRVRLIDDVAVAECRVRYWSPSSSSGGELCRVLPDFGTFRVAINSETNQLISFGCTSADGGIALGTISAEKLDDVYETAGVPLYPGPLKRKTKSLDM